MKALILNSGMGSRMKNLTIDRPKCMVQIDDESTILQRQLELLLRYNIDDIIITTGYKNDILVDYINHDLNYLFKSAKISFIHNDIYDKTNYIYSMYLAKALLNDDIILMHGDLVFEEKVIEKLLDGKFSKMIVSSEVELPLKDFKAKIINKKIVEISIDTFDNSFAAQPLYYFKKNDFKVWMDEIVNFINSGISNVYAENAFNKISDKIDLFPLDIKDLLCMEVDCENDLKIVKNKLER